MENQQKPEAELCDKTQIAGDPVSHIHMFTAQST